MSATSNVPMSPRRSASGSVASSPEAARADGSRIWVTVTPLPPAVTPAVTSESTNDFASPGNDCTIQIQNPM